MLSRSNKPSPDISVLSLFSLLRLIQRMVKRVEIGLIYLQIVSIFDVLIHK
jgi:hypothetical protein